MIVIAVIITIVICAAIILIPVYIKDERDYQRRLDESLDRRIRDLEKENTRLDLLIEEDARLTE